MKILADSRIFETILRNLISNAFRYIQSGGSIKVEGIDQGNKIEIRVEDDGVGMSTDDLDSLYDIKTASQKGK